MRTEYDRLFAVASRFGETLQEQVETLLRSRKLTLGVPIERRVKEWPSIAEKLKRKHVGAHLLTELDDLVGLRIILLFSRDLLGIHELLYENFQVLAYEDTAIRLEESQFGYQSVHYIVGLPGAWLLVPTMTEFKGLKAEIQVRTLSQHIWAAASHKLQYKREASVPLRLRRSIHRISAVLETVDLEFERLLQERENYVKELENLADDSPLNVEVLRRILESKWPTQNRDEDEDYSELVDDLGAFQITTSTELIKLIDESYNRVMKEEQQMLSNIEAEDQLSGTTEERNKRGVYFTFVGLTRTALSVKFPDKWANYNASKSLNNPRTE